MPTNSAAKRGKARTRKPVRKAAPKPTAVKLMAKPRMAPKPIHRQAVNVHVEAKLYRQARNHMCRRGHTVRQVFAMALQNYMDGNLVMAPS